MAGAARFVADCNVNSATLVGHVKVTLAPKKPMLNSGADIGNETLKTVPNPALPPAMVVPYKVLPDKNNLELGSAPSLFVTFGAEPVPLEKLYKFVKPYPSVPMANTVPLLKAPPWLAVPYKVLFHNITPAWGLAPSVPPVKS